MKRNEFREIADRQLSDLQWDEAKTRRVLEAIDGQESRGMGSRALFPARRKMSLAMALAVILTLLATTALAVALIRYSPWVNHEDRARRLLMSQYGLTRETLGLFRSKVTEENGETVVDFTPIQWEDDFTGVYTVRISGGKETASWTYDGLDPALWQDGNFDAPVWGPPQLAGYLAEGWRHELSEAYRGQHIRDYSEVDARPTPEATDFDMDAYWNGEMWLYEAVRAEGDMTFEQAREITRAAIREMYDVSEAEAAGIDFFEGHLIEWDDGRHVWDVWGFLYLDGVDMGFAAVVDAQSGEVLRTFLETGGNG